MITIGDGYKTLIYNPGSNVKIVNNPKYFESIIVDGEERITSPDVSGELVVETLSDPGVKVKFKPEITDIWGCFENCSNLVEISENLFYDNPEITSFNNCFYSCTGLTSIPGSLFSKNIKVIDFSTCFCYTGLTSIPENLFSNNPNVTDFNTCFYDCTSLTTIPENLFANNRKVTKFRYCFSGCSSLQIMPIDSDGTPIYNRSGEGKERYSIVTSFDDCFRNCISIEGYDQIPIEWK